MKIADRGLRIVDCGKIPLAQIDLSDETFSVNYCPDLSMLRSSIEEVGLIEPITLEEGPGEEGPGGYRIVCGFRRAAAQRELGETEIESRVFEKEGADPFTLFLVALHENLTTRGFNAVEKAIALDKLVHHFQIERNRVIKTFLPLFSLETNEKILNTFLLLARMEDELKRYVLKEGVSRSNIRFFSTFGSEDRRAILSLVSSLKLSENRLREILTFLQEISQRNRCSVTEIAHLQEVKALSSQEEITPSQRTERLRKILWDLRYPRMRQAEEAFEKRKKALSLPSGISLHHPSFFEGKKLRIEFQFETLEEYQSVLHSLSTLPEKKTFRDMMEDDPNVKFQNPNVKGMSNFKKDSGTGSE